MGREAAAGEGEAMDSLEGRKKGEWPCSSKSSQLTSSDSTFCLGSIDRCWLFVTQPQKALSTLKHFAQRHALLGINSLAAYFCDNVM